MLELAFRVLRSMMLEHRRIGLGFRKTFDVSAGNREHDRIFAEFGYFGRIDEAKTARSPAGVDDDAVEDVGVRITEHMLHHADPLAIGAHHIGAAFKREI